MMDKEWTLGKHLKVGDVIEVWWQPGRDRITNLKPYKGSLSHIWNGEARLASFAISKIGMTIEPDAPYYKVDELPW
jgi:hypothetical protein